MFKTAAFAAVSIALAILPPAALAQQGASSSYGTVGSGPVIPTQSLTPRDRAWNHDHQAKYQAEDGAEFLREKGNAFPPF